MSDFLLELRSEEIPARMQAGARAELEKLFREELISRAFEIAKDGITVWSTPRRLVLIARGLPDATEAVSMEEKGPPEGAPDQAIDGFCRKTGVPRNQLEIRDLKGRPTYFAVKSVPGIPMKDVLAEAIPAIVRAFAWPKSMRWGAASISSESPRWVRPLSGIVAIFGEELVPCEAAGVASGYATVGHRFHHPGEITIGGAHDYAEKLRACHVIVDHAERQDLVRAGAAKAAADAGLELVEDEGLVVENAGLTEWPVPLLGRFDEAFLEVPPEVIQLTARTNQKYFICRTKQGELANAFVCTANVVAADGGAAIVDGNRKVLAARLSDARFFWEQDRKKTLEQHAGKLANIVFHEKLGTVADKVERVAKLARWLVEEDIVVPAKAGTAVGSEQQPIPAFAGMTREKLAALAEQAARLAKADLVTEMVGEFPELQGLMGGYYARAEGLPDAVADAIRDHYKPVGQGDEVPTAPVTVAVSLADKLDTLICFFSEAMDPTGSKDPFALRRAALSVIRQVLAFAQPFNLKKALFEARYFYLEQYGQKEFARIFELIKTGHASAIDHLAEMQVVQESDYPHLYDILERSEKLGAEYQIDDERISRIAQAYVGRLTHVEHQASWIVVERLVDFFADRLKVQQREAGVRHDLIDAVFALGNEDDLVRLLARVKALQNFIATEDGANLLAAYKRAANILKKEDWKGAEGEIARTGEEDPLALVDDPDLKPVIEAKLAERKQKELSYTLEPAEKALIEALDSAEPTAAAAVSAEDFEGAMAALATLRAPIDRFFDEVTVNDADQNKRAARLDLLARFRAAVHKVADFSKIEG